MCIYFRKNKILFLQIFLSFYKQTDRMSNGDISDGEIPIAAWENSDAMTKFASEPLSNIRDVRNYAIQPGDLVALYYQPYQSSEERNFVVSKFNGMNNSDFSLAATVAGENNPVNPDGINRKYFGICKTSVNARATGQYPQNRDLSIVIAGMTTVKNYLDTPMIKAGDKLGVVLRWVIGSVNEARLVFVPLSDPTFAALNLEPKAKALCDSDFNQRLQILLIP